MTVQIARQWHHQSVTEAANWGHFHCFSFFFGKFALLHQAVARNVYTIGFFDDWVFLNLLAGSIMQKQKGLVTDNWFVVHYRYSVQYCSSWSRIQGLFEKLLISNMQYERQMCAILWNIFVFQNVVQWWSINWQTIRWLNIFPLASFGAISNISHSYRNCANDASSRALISHC